MRRLTLLVLLGFVGTGCQRPIEELEPKLLDEVDQSQMDLEQKVDNTEKTEEDSIENNNRDFYEDITLITNPDSYLVLVNKNNALSSSYVPGDLVVPNILNIDYRVGYNIFMRMEAAGKLEQLFQAAYTESKLTLLALSGYRSYEHQAQVYNEYVRLHGQDEADRFSARPGHSEHQTGLAIDVTSESAGRKLNPEFGNTAEGLWVKQNAHRFGYIIRYPLEREQDTGYDYEPWHLRYVGVEAATEIYENNLILEEYLGKW